MDYEQLFQVAATGDQQALAELDRRLESEPRQVDYDYELRHPGHGDQSVHNPHKGGGGAAGGEWTPGGLKLEPRLTRAKLSEKMRSAHGYPPTRKGLDYAYQQQKSMDTYTNGPLTIKVNNKQSPKPTAAELKIMDETGGDIVRRYPGELNVTWQKNYDDGPFLMGKASIGTRSFRVTPRAAMEYDGRSGGDNLKYAMWHESGHAIPMKALKDLGRPDVTGQKTLGAIKNSFDSAIPDVPFLSKRYGKGFKDDAERNSAHSIMRSQISKYGTDSYTEGFAEAIAIWHTGEIKGKTNKNQVDIINAIAKVEGWKP
jgi:hypothetical protein